MVCGCWEKLVLCSPCKLNVIGYASGWLGIVWRSVCMGFLSSIISRITSYDPNLYSIFLITSLVYILLSMVANLVFIYGIFMVRRHFMLPYISVVALELTVGVIVSSGLVMVLFVVNAVLTAVYLLFAALFVIGLHFTMWIYGILLFKDLEYEARIRKGDKTAVRMTRIRVLDD